MPSIINRTFLHSTHVRDTGMGEDAVVVSELIKYDDGTVKPSLRVFNNPKRPFWFTKPEFQNHKYKKEFERKERLDEFQVHNHELDKEVFRAVNGFAPNDRLTYGQKVKLYQNPYIYGANIDIQALIADKYRRDLEKHTQIPIPPTIGTLDIETSVRNDGTYGRIEIITYTHENESYTAILKECMSETTEDGRRDFSVSDVEELASQTIEPLIERLIGSAKGVDKIVSKFPMKREYFVGTYPIDLVRWIFSKINERKTSFIGIWNLDFDLPKILSCIEEAGLRPEDIFSPSTLDRRFRHFRYAQDTRKVQHPTNKWHVVHATSNSRFIDAMCLYSYIRTADGKEITYALDAIMKKHGLEGKFHWNLPKLGKATKGKEWHLRMQQYYFKHYIVYNLGDTTPFQILEWVTQDIPMMLMLSEITPLAKFPKQTVRATNTMYSEWKDRGWIIASVLENPVEDGDEDLTSKGGAVVSPKQFSAKGMKLFIEWPTHWTRCLAFGNDLDLSSQYPSAIQSMNISRGTQIAAVVGITAPWVQKRYDPEIAVEVFFSYMISQNANGVEIGKEFFQLKGYEEMSTSYDEYRKTKRKDYVREAA